MLGHRRSAAAPAWAGWAAPVRWATLLALLFFVAWAATQLGEPRRWAWWETALASSRPAASIPTHPAAPRRAPFPDEATLAGALDGEPFWSETARNPLRGRDFERHLRDADARYHLLLLAAAVEPGVLEQDAEPAPAWDALMAHPDRYRGRLLRFQGHLFGLRRMPLSRDDVPGLKSCFQAFLTVGASQERLCVLFPREPADADWPPEEQWARMWRRDVGVAGYFLKVVRIDGPKPGEEPTLLPVLVARTLLWPPDAEGAAPTMHQGLWVFGLMAAPVLVLALWLRWQWRRGDRPLRQRLADVTARRQADDARGMAAWAEGETPPDPEV
ncbi:MAG TPA: hypothetical protein PKD86_03180 [Gemmatales bacterium]|nr:hypothetical protein [Gemmatales bacterium]HMP58336.1 hypothetical protein [Gemmatales bacterium]